MPPTLALSPRVIDRPTRLAGWVRAIVLALALALTGGTSARAQRPTGETFGKTPTTALEFWDAADYLVRTGQAPQAVPYLNKFLQAKPDDSTLIEVRDRYGAGSILRLQDHPATRAMAEPLASMLAAATRRTATNPERIARFIADLSKSRAEQEYAVERLREAGSFAVPPLVRELGRPSLSAEGRAQIVANMGRLDRSAAPALIAVLDASDQPRLAADAAEVLGAIGDPRAVVPLTALAANPAAAVPARDAARRAVARITGRPFEAQPKTPTRLLADEARRYHTHAIQFPGDSLVLWGWDAPAQAPAPQTLSRSDAEGVLGLKFARAALAIDPTDRPAQTTALALTLEKAIERAGFTRFPADDPSRSFALATSSGASVLGDVLRQAIADGKTDLAAVAAQALGKVADPSALAVDGQANPLVEALSAPGRRARFAAARALVNLDPRRPFAGSSRVVPVLVQFATSQGPPRALVIDGNTSRGGQLSGLLKALGYEPFLVQTGPEGFKTASDSADVEVIFVDIHMIAGDWRLHDVLSNLKADARTSGIPVFIVGPLNREADLLSIPRRFPGVKFLVTSTDPKTLDQQLAIAGRPAPPSPAERAATAREAATLLARIATGPNSPFEHDLAGIEPELMIALNTPGTDLAASSALGDVPDPNAQRSLADVSTDPGKAAPLRLSAATQLARSVQRFGPLVSKSQEVQLLSAFEREADPALRNALGAVIGALRPTANPTGQRPRRPVPTSTGPDQGPRM